ncbi:PulJ/GspJ family protein [Nitratidesulfovibrio sp. 1201_IL3209]|uniref:PulJ/GspJ family protein n=1 Tax=Nitratidesulfovibrio sp. 1201_IL3209 TaxID=3084053 RepID=UPI002FD8F42A
MNMRGFTLIEVIVVLMLTGIFAAVAGTGIVTGMRSFVETRAAAELAQHAQLVQDRMAREITELTEAKSGSTAQKIVIGNISGDRTVEYDSASREIVIISPASGSGTYQDTLADNVAAFGLRYFRGEDNVSSTWPPSSGVDPRELAAVEVSFTLTSPIGVERQFVTRIVPRNNQNMGGNLPSTEIPSLAKYDFCFIATAAYGDIDHPVVTTLREFRDKRLLPHAPGRAMVQAYYAVGPHLARLVEGAPHAQAALRAALHPVAALALLAVHAPAHLALSVILCVALVAAVARALRTRPEGDAMYTQRGAVLLSTIVTIVTFAALAAGVVALMTSSTQSGYFVTQGDQAYYLAEAGFNAAASMYLHEGEGDTEQDLARKELLERFSDKPFSLGSAGSFRLEAEPYWFETISSTNNSITAKIYGVRRPAVSHAGRLRIGQSSTTVAFSSVSNSGSGSSITFSGITNLSGITNDTDIFLSARATVDTSVGKGGTLTLSGNSNALANFPEFNGMFTVRGEGNSGNLAYVYRKRDGTSLQDVRLADGQADEEWPLVVRSGSDVTLERFLRLYSTGVTPDGTERLVTYNVPIGGISGGVFNKERFVDSFDTAGDPSNRWVTGGEGKGQLGSHNVQTIDGGTALKVTEMKMAAERPSGGFISWLIAIVRAIGSWLTGSNQWSTIFFDWSKTNINMARAWLDAGKNLSYDAQVKVYAQQADNNNSTPKDQELELFGGMLLRGAQNGDDLDGIGLSFVRSYRERERRQTCTIICWGDWTAWSGYSLSTSVDNKLIPGYVSPTDFGPLFGEISGHTLYKTTKSTRVLGGEIERETQYSHPAIVLWKRENGQFRWLAYKRLHATNIVNSNNKYKLRNWSTLLMRITEGRDLGFTGAGGSATADFNYGDFVETKNAESMTVGRGRVIGPPIVTSQGWNPSTGVWNNGAAGTLVLSNVEGTMGSGNLVVNNTQVAQSAATPGGKATYLRVYYGGATRTGGDNIPANEGSRANARLAAGQSPKWTPDDYALWTGANGNEYDNFTLVEWEGVASGVNGMNEIIATQGHTRSILKLNGFTTSDADPSTDPNARPPVIEGIALVSAGSTGTTIAFDDFGLQIDIRGGQGFLPPIQQ